MVSPARRMSYVLYSMWETRWAEPVLLEDRAGDPGLDGLLNLPVREAAVGSVESAGDVPGPPRPAVSA